MTVPEDNLTKSDWQYISYHMTQAFNKARPKASEGKPSKEFLSQEKRILNYLDKKSFSQEA